MKKQIKKLTLNKRTISNLNSTQMNRLIGATGYESCHACGSWDNCGKTKNGNSCPGHNTCNTCPGLWTCYTC